MTVGYVFTSSTEYLSLVSKRECKAQTSHSNLFRLFSHRFIYEPIFSLQMKNLMDVMSEIVSTIRSLHERVVCGINPEVPLFKNTPDAS